MKTKTKISERQVLDLLPKHTSLYKNKRASTMIIKGDFMKQYCIKNNQRVPRSKTDKALRLTFYVDCKNGRTRAYVYNHKTDKWDWVHCNNKHYH